MAQDKLDKVSITDQLEQLQLEETQERIKQMRERKEANRRRLLSRDTDVRNANARLKAQQDGCWQGCGDAVTRQ